MNYLEKEIDEACITLAINAKKLGPEELTTVVTALTKHFFKFQSNVLDAVEINEKSTEHNPDFWKEIQHRIDEKNLFLLVFDSTYKGWEIDCARDITSILGETSGYPFWVTDRKLTFLVHMDDHDCVIWA
ncbi:hypothetical protein [Pseudomonas sp. W4I3]|uniref:hypothetical protein n=1 Tax=Pseudomonas sp. W4I3 TaxID=3042294 RepID=UPI002780D730|nr:hypothetical protein [Pseudomonas sp. W4I3]MDQ0739357.1 hypothetical protein [Pseudomonas sp. W4I3]